MSSILFLPGLLCSRELFAFQMQQLPAPFQADYSDLPPLASMEEMASQLWQNRQNKVIICGLSMGGIVAMEMFRQHPERVQGLILMNTNALDETPESSRRRYDLVERAAELGPGEMSLRYLMPLLVHPLRLDDSELRQTVYTMAQSSGQKRLGAHAHALARRRNYTPVLQTLNCPVLIIAGKEDLLCPEDRLKNLRAAVPHANVQVVEHCGHLSTLEKPEGVSGLINKWLGGLQLSTPSHDSTEP